jgi:hypothetical protein
MLYRYNIYKGSKSLEIHAGSAEERCRNSITGLKKGITASHEKPQGQGL